MLQELVFFTDVKLLLRYVQCQLHELWCTTYYFLLFLDPYFVPEISVKGVTLNSITIGWSQPPEEMRDHVHYYMLIVQNNSTTKEAFHPEQSMNLFLFTDLQAATTYHFKVSFICQVQRPLVLVQS
jgi:hypothetical protein